MNIGKSGMNYASIGVIAFLVHIIINYDVLIRAKEAEKNPSHLYYKIFLFCVLAFYIFDSLWGFVYDLKVPLVAYVWTELYFVSVAITVFFWTRFVINYIQKTNYFTTLLKYSGIIFLGFEFLVLAINLFFPVMFYFDESGGYHTANARTATMFAQILLFLATSIYMFVAGEKNQGTIRRRHRAVGAFGIAMTIFVVLATMYPILPFYAMGYLLGTCLLHTFVVEDEKEERRKELEQLLTVEEIQEQEIGSARLIAYTDPLTGIKSANAYQEDVIGIDMRIHDKILKDFGIVVFDINGLKLINDTKGHEEGDKLIKSGCNIICQTFKHSPIYRIGGDEIVAFLKGDDLKNRERLLDGFAAQMEKNILNGEVVIAWGLSEFIPNQDKEYSAIFTRADQKMYEQKKLLKDKQSSTNA